MSFEFFEYGTTMNSSMCSTNSEGTNMWHSQQTKWERGLISYRTTFLYMFICCLSSSIFVQYFLVKFLPPQEMLWVEAEKNIPNSLKTDFFNTAVRKQCHNTKNARARVYVKMSFSCNKSILSLCSFSYYWQIFTKKNIP